MDENVESIEVEDRILDTVCPHCRETYTFHSAYCVSETTTADDPISGLHLEITVFHTECPFCEHDNPVTKNWR